MTPEQDRRLALNALRTRALNYRREARTWRKDARYLEPEARNGRRAYLENAKEANRLATSLYRTIRILEKGGTL